MAVRVESHAEPIPGYRLLERIGGGGFGEVWKAEAPGGLLKAIKFVYGQLDTIDSTDASRAEQELKALSRVKSVRHPFILSLERFDVIDSQLIIVMELADRSLWDRFRECRAKGMLGIPRDELLGYLEETAEALDLMNLQYDLQHLDIKPQNLFLVHSHVKVADFGLVKDLEGLAASVTGGVTPVYAAPETFEGWVSRFSDQYSLAIVYQELLTGQRPFGGNNTRQLIMQHLQGQPNLEPLPPDDRPLVARSLAKNPSDRHPSCLELVRALRIADQEAPQLHLPNIPDLPVETPLVTEFLRPEVDGQESTAKPAETTDVTPPQGVLDDQDREEAAVADAGEELRSQPLPTTSPRRVCAEQRGEGVLFPALVIGLGRVGRGALQALRHELRLRHGPTAELPHLRLVAIDTDPEAVQTRNADSRGMEEVLLTRLNRPSRYLRPRDALPPLDEWLPPKMVYRIPRSLVTLGIRALGRLAFIDHYRTIVAELQRVLQEITDEQAWTAAARETGLELRSTWPRAYIVTSLAGGTGGGMFLDLAYVVRRLLREAGFSRQEVVGLFYLPPVHERAETALPLANSYAALVELNHFMTSGKPFQARYESRRTPLRDGAPPFGRCVFLPLPLGSEAASLQELAALAGGYLYRDIMTPLGRACDQARANPDGATPEAMGNMRSPPGCFQDFGVHTIASPQHLVLGQAARRLGKRITEGWTLKPSPDHGPRLQQEMLAWLRQEQLDPESLYRQLDAECVKQQERAPAEVFAEWLATARASAAEAGFNLRAIEEVVRQSDEMLGSPLANNALLQGLVPNTLREAAETIFRHSGAELAERALQYLDQPSDRVAGAEEAVRQSISVVEQWLQQTEAAISRVTANLQALMERLRQQVAEIDKAGVGKRTDGRRAQLIAGAFEQLGHYPELRYQQLLLQRVVGIYISLRGHLSDQIKELGFCRKRLRDLPQFFDAPCPEDLPADASLGKTLAGASTLFPGCDSLSEAVDQTVSAFSDAELAHLEETIQPALRRNFPSLVQVCNAPNQRLQDLRRWMVAEVQALLQQQMPCQDVAELMQQRFPDQQALKEALWQAFEEAIPGVLEQGLTCERELTLLAAPDSDAGRRIRTVAQSILPECQTVLTRSKDEIVIYRESIGIQLEDLKQLGPAAREAYDLSCSLEHFSPHTRLDIAEWKEIA